MGQLEGNLLIVAAVVADAISVILAKVSGRSRISPGLLAHLSFIIGLATIAPFALAVHGMPQIIDSIRQAPLSAHMGVWFMALVSGTLACTLRNRAVQTIEVSETAPFIYLFPLWGAPLSVLWLGEKITTPFLVGGSIIAVGVILAEQKRRKKH